MIPFFYVLFELYPGTILENKDMHPIFHKKGKKKQNTWKFGQKIQNLWIFWKKAGDSIGPAVCWYISFLDFKISTSNLCHKHQQEIYVTLSRFWLLGVRRAWVNALEKETLSENYFSDNVEWSSEKLWKMVSPDIKTDVKQ